MEKFNAQDFRSVKNFGSLLFSKSILETIVSRGIQALAPTPYGFPWLAYLDGGYYNQASDGQVYTLEGGDLPYILLQLDHQVAELLVEIYDADTGEPIHPVFNRAVDIEYQGRNSTTTSFFAIAWDGTRIHSEGHNGQGYVKNFVKEVPDGNYILVVKVLKALGDPKNPDHWETWSSPMLVLDRP